MTNTNDAAAGTPIPKRYPFRLKKAEPVADPIDGAVDRRSCELPRLLTPQEVADHLGVGRRTVDRWRITGEGPTFVKLSAQTVRYTAEAVTRFIAERAKANTVS